MPSWSMRPKPVCLSWDRSMAKTIRSKSTGSKSSLLTGSMLELAALPSCTRCILPIPGPLWPPGDAVVTSGAARWHAQQSNSGGQRARHFQNVKRSGLHRYKPQHLMLDRHGTCTAAPHASAATCRHVCRQHVPENCVSRKEDRGECLRVRNLVAIHCSKMRSHILSGTHTDTRSSAP